MQSCCSFAKNFVIYTQIPSRSKPSAGSLTWWPELRSLSTLPFSTAAGWGEPEARVGAKNVLLGHDEKRERQGERACVCMCVWQRSERWLLLVCFEFFFSFPAPRFDLPSHPFIPHAPCASGLLFAAQRRAALERDERRGRQPSPHRDAACSLARLWAVWRAADGGGREVGAGGGRSSGL